MEFKKIITEVFISTWLDKVDNSKNNEARLPKLRYPYKLEIKPTLTDNSDKAQNFQMCPWRNEMMENDKH